jgi:hypothetical protein
MHPHPSTQLHSLFTTTELDLETSLTIPSHRTRTQEPTQIQVTQKPMQRPEMYARALRAILNCTEEEVHGEQEVKPLPMK